MSDIIKSSQNKYIKHIKALEAKKYRDEYDEFVIEGIKMLEEAMDYDIHVSLVVFGEEHILSQQMQELYAACRRKGIESIVVTEKLLRELSDTVTPQGVMAVLKKPAHTLEGVVGQERVGLILLDEIKDPGNMGTIIRTADACGLNAVVLSKGCVDLYNPKTIRSTMGSLFHIPVITGADLLQVLQALHDHGIITIGAAPHAAADCFDIVTKGRAAIAIGNEAHGLSKPVMDSLSANAKIPMPGKAESLNAGIAAALMMYEFFIRR